MNMQEQSDKRSLALHRAVVRKLRENPELWDKPLQNIERWTESDGGLPMPFKIWKDILEATPREDIIKLLLSRSQRATQLRSSSPFTGIIRQEERNQIFEQYNKIYHRGKVMKARKFSIAELEKMFEDYGHREISLLPDDVIAKEFSGHVRREISDAEAYALKNNTLNISKQLLALLSEASGFSATELETMIYDYESFIKSPSRSDIQNELAGKLPHKIFWITKQLIELLEDQAAKQELQELRETVREYLKRPSLDGAPIRQEQRKKLAELVKES